MPRGRPKKKERDPSKPPIQRWTPRKWAAERGEKYVRALEAAGPDFIGRFTAAHVAMEKASALSERIARLKSQLERLEGMRTNDTPAELAMEECEKILIGIVNTLPEVTAKPKPEPEAVEVGVGEGDAK